MLSLILRNKYVNNIIKFPREKKHWKHIYYYVLENIIKKNNY